MTSPPLPEPRLQLQGFLPYRLSITSNLVSDVIASTYEALFGLRIAEWRLITVLAEADGLTQQEIGARTRMDKVTVSRAASALGDRALVARRAHPGDRRSHLLTLSRTGHDLYASVAPKALQLERRIFDGFSAEELAALTLMLQRIDASALKLLQADDA